LLSGLFKSSGLAGSFGDKLNHKHTPFVHPYGLTSWESTGLC